MALLNYILGNRAGTFILVSSLLVVTLATISAIIDIPLQSLQDAGVRLPGHRSAFPVRRLFPLVGLPASLIVFLSAATQAYVASAPAQTDTNGLLLFIVGNIAFLLALLTWGLASPLTRHWGLGLACFGVGLAVLFPLLAVVFRLHFRSSGILDQFSERLIFAFCVGAILCAVGACIASILSMLKYVVQRSVLLIAGHRLHAAARTATAQEFGKGRGRARPRSGTQVNRGERS